MKVRIKGLVWFTVFLLLSNFMLLTFTNPTANVIGSIIGDSANDNFGFSVSAACDFNGDSIDDIIIGAPGHNNTNGAAYIFFGGIHFEGELTPVNANITILGPQTGLNVKSKFGYSVSNAGDLNMDGYYDVVIGAPKSQNAYIFLGYSVPGTPLTLNCNNANVTLNGSANNEFGFAVGSAGDINNDFYEDVMVSDPYYNLSGSNPAVGQVYVFYGQDKLQSQISYQNANLTFEGESKHDYFGWNLSYAGDLNNDTVADLIVGAPYFQNAPTPGDDGAAYIYFGGSWLDNTTQPIPTTSANVSLLGGKKTYFGWSVSNAGDVNLDGFDDVIVSAPLYDTSRGSCYIYYGSLAMDNIADVTLVGENNGDNFGKSVSSAGDYDKDDNNDDIAVGAPGANNNGATYIFYGSENLPSTISAASADTIMIGENNLEQLGFTVANAGSIIKSHEYDKLIIGAPYYNDPIAGVDVGKIYISGYKSWAPITLNILEGWSFQDEAPSQINDTSRLIYKDTIWAPDKVPGYVDYTYSTSTQANWWDAFTVKFDMSKYDPADYDAILKFYAKNNETTNCYGSNDNRYKIYDGYMNATDQDAGPPNATPVVNYPSLTDPLADTGTEYERWYKFAVPDSWWSKGINWFTIRLWDGQVDTVKIILVSTEIKTLYLHDDVDADTDPAVDDEMYTVPNSALLPLELTLKADVEETHQWVLEPEFATDFHILGDVDFNLWVNTSATEYMSVKAALYEFTDPGYIKFAETTYELGNSLSTPTEVSIELPGIDYEIVKGRKLIVEVTATGPIPGNLQPGDTITLYFNGTSTGNSYLDMPTDTVIDVAWIKTYNLLDQELSTFTVGDNITIRANLTDPFGSYDISTAIITITAPNATVIVNDQFMTLEKVDGNSPSVWKLFNYSFSNPILSGIYTVKITAVESNNVTAKDTTVYFLDPDLPYEIKLSLDPSTITADGVNSSNIEIWIFDKYDNPIPGLEASINLGLDAGGGSFGPITGYGDGHYNVTFTSPTTADPDSVINISVSNIFNKTTIILVPGPLDHITVTPFSIDVVAGTNQNFQAKGYDLYNNEVFLLVTIWSTTVGSMSSQTSTSANLDGQTLVAKGYVNATIGLVVGSAGVNIVPDVLDHINITPSSANVTVNMLQNFDAAGYDKYNNEVQLTNTMWSTDVGIITDQNNDQATFKAQSTIASGYVNARQNTIAKSVEVNVVPDVLFRISISPDPVNVTAGGSQDFTAVGYDLYNNIVPISPVWNTNVGTMDSATLNAKSVVGSGYVNATVGTISTSATVNIVPGALNLIIISPSSISLEVDKITGFSAIGYDKYNNMVTIDPSWTSTVGTMNGPLFTAQTQVAKGYVNATFSSITGSAVVNLIPGPLDHITIRPTKIDIVAGQSIDFEAYGNDKYNNTVIINPTWYTDIGTMSGNTLYGQTSTGMGTVIATYMGINGVANVTIIPDELNSVYVAPPYVEIIIGQSQDFSATGFDKYNNMIGVNPIWTTNVGYMMDNIFIAQDLPGVGTVTATVSLNSTMGSISGVADVHVVLGDFLGRPEIVGDIPDQEKYEDSPPWILDLTPYESDLQDAGQNLDWEVTGENTSLYLLTGELSNDDVLRFTPLPNVYGSDQITIWLIDSDGFKDFQVIWINLTPVNDKPTIFGAPDIILHFDDPYVFDYEPYIYDVDNPKSDLTLSTIEASDTKYTEVDGFYVTYNYPRSMLNRDVFVTIAVFDGEALSEDMVKITVTDDWVPKLEVKLPDVILYEGKNIKNVFDLDDHFSDPDKDALFYSSGETHVTVTINENNTVDIASYSQWSGTDTVTFRAEDPIGALAEDTIVVTVLPVNDRPDILGVPDLTVRYDYDFEFDLSPHISDIDNELDDLTVSTSVPKYIKFDNQNKMIMTINFPESMKGQSITVTISVSDGIESSSQVISILVSDNYPPEIVKYLPNIEFYEDEILTNAMDLDDYFIDPDGGLLHYNIDEYIYDQIIVWIHNNNTVDFTAPLNWHGKEQVIFRAKDGLNAVQEDAIIVTVIPVNDAPAIKTIPDQKGKVGQVWVLDLTKFVSDVESNITELEIVVNHEFVTISGLNLLFYSDKVADSEEILLEVNDGEIITTHKFNVTFAAGEEVITISELVYWSVVIIILIVIISMIIAYKKFKGKYKVEDVYLIFKDGTLLAHKSSRAGKGADDDILSGMLTAIQEFVKEGFGRERILSSSAPLSTKPTVSKPKIDEWQLQQLKVRGHDILIEHGTYAYIAILYSGKTGWKLTNQVKDTLKSIEKQYAYSLETWDGNMAKIAGVDKFLAPLVTSGENINNNLNFRPKIAKLPGSFQKNKKR